jgi:hypothetical protein
MARTSAVITTRPDTWKTPSFLVVPFRYLVTGYPILRPRDNASFLYDATEDYRGKPIPKFSRARWQRVARRNAAITVPALLYASCMFWTPLWIAHAWVIGCLLVAVTWLIWRMVNRLHVHNPVRWIRNRRVNREFVDPAAQVLCTILGQRYLTGRARRMLELPHGWGTGDDVAEDGAVKIARVWLPAGTPLDAGVKKRITEQVGKRLGIPNPVGDWNEAGANPFVDIKGAPNAPREVLWSSLLPAIAKCAEDEVVVGRESGNRLVILSASEDSPHFSMSGPSGTGKSVLGKVFLSQRLHRGDGVFMLDPKRWSHWKWAGGGKLPTDRLVYAYKTEDIHEAWLAIAEEAARRIELDEPELEKLRRVWVVVEEINTQTKRLARYWKAERKRIQAAAKRAKAEDMDYDEGDLDPPLQSPAIVAMQESVGMGRELRMHVLVMAQRLSAGVFGGNGGDIRESFQGGRLIARWDRKLWKMLVDTIAYVACPTGPRGIWGLARGEEFTVFRVPNLTDAEATAFALSGAPAYGPVLGEQTSRPVIDLQEEQPAITSAVTLAAALDLLPGQDGPASISLNGLRTAAGRAGFPEPLAKPDGKEYGKREARLYDLAELVEWQEARLSIKV